MRPARLDRRRQRKKTVVWPCSVHIGMPKFKPLIKFLSEGQQEHPAKDRKLSPAVDNKKEMPKADAPLYFVIDEKDNSVGTH